MKIKIIFCFGFLSVMFFLIFSSWFIIPEFLNAKVDEACNFTINSSLFEYWKDLYNSIDSEFHVFLFNITNPEEVQEGSKPQLKEIGPYVFDLKMEHVNIKENRLNNSVEYYVKKTYYFNEKKSNGSSDDIFTVPNLLLTNGASEVNAMMPELLPVFSQTLPYLFPDMKDMFLRESLRDIIFDGVLLHCDDPDADFARFIMEIMEMKYLRLAEDGINYKFSLLKNESVDGPFEMFTGQDNFTKRGTLTKYKNTHLLNIWTDECDEIHGTDGCMYTKPVEKTNGIDFYVPEICRSIHFSYDKDYKTEGLNLRRFNFSEYDNNFSKDCYCPVIYNLTNGNEKKSCPMNGLVDIKPCLGYSILLSLPHFYLSDPKLVENVEGLHPDKNNHGSLVVLDDITFSPISEFIRLQYNVELKARENVVYLGNVSDVIIPVGWFQMKMVLKDNLKSEVRNAGWAVLIAKVSKWVLGFIASSLIVVFVTLCIYYQFFSKEITGKFSLTNKSNTKLSDLNNESIIKDENDTLNK